MAWLLEDSEVNSNTQSGEEHQNSKYNWSGEFTIFLFLWYLPAWTQHGPTCRSEQWYRDPREAWLEEQERNGWNRENEGNAFCFLSSFFMLEPPGNPLAANGSLQEPRVWGRRA